MAGTLGHATLSGTSSTVLAQRLAPPAEPALKWKASGGQWAACLLLACTTIGFIPAAIYVVSERRSYERNAREIAHPRWRRMMQRWNELFYCHRCDIVFNPQERTQARVGDMHILLNTGVSEPLHTIPRAGNSGYAGLPAVDKALIALFLATLAFALLYWLLTIGQNVSTWLLELEVITIPALGVVLLARTMLRDHANRVRERAQ